jgi:hypothetical protein
MVVGEIDVPRQDISEWTWAKISQDGGRTWRWLRHDDEIPLVDAEVARADAEQKQACVPDEPAVCYRVVPGHLRVEQIHDGGVTWETSWEVDDATRDRLARELPKLEDPAKNLSSHALVVHRTDTGYVVVVANGRDGYARRDEDGRWQRIGFGVDEDTPTSPTPGDDESDRERRVVRPSVSPTTTRHRMRRAVGHHVSA